MRVVQYPIRLPILRLKFVGKGVFEGAGDRCRLDIPPGQGIQIRVSIDEGVGIYPAYRSGIVYIDVLVLRELARLFLWVKVFNSFSVTLTI